MFIFGVVFIKEFLFFMYVKSVVFLSKFCRTKFPPEAPDLTDFGFPWLLVYEGALSVEATLLPCLLLGPFEWSRFEIYLILVFFLAC